jgi:hypothetical protein
MNKNYKFPKQPNHERTGDSTNSQFTSNQYSQRSKQLRISKLKKVIEDFEESQGVMHGSFETKQKIY